MGFILSMKTFILGNAGSGKTTLARELETERGAARLSLDEVAFDGGMERMPIGDSIAKVRGFIQAHESWVIEGCYADIIAAVIEPDCELWLLNPGVEICVARCRARVWEPEKFATQDEQQEHLDALIEWVRTYEARSDEYGLLAHRRLFDGFTGSKREIA